MTGYLQYCKNIIQNIKIMLNNYTVIFEKAIMLNFNYKIAFGKQIFYITFKIYISLIEIKLKNCCHLFHTIAFKNLETKIKNLLKTKDDNRDIN